MWEKLSDASEAEAADSQNWNRFQTENTSVGVSLIRHLNIIDFKSVFC